MLGCACVKGCVSVPALLCPPVNTAGAGDTAVNLGLFPRGAPNLQSVTIQCSYFCEHLQVTIALTRSLHRVTYTSILSYESVIIPMVQMGKQRRERLICFLLAGKT